jgi:creatinine amidohydrolase
MNVSAAATSDLSVSVLDCPHHRARTLLATGAPVYVSFNPVEYHGPHLSLRNDGLICAAILRDLLRRQATTHPNWPLLSGGDLDLGVDPVPGPGSRPVSYFAMREVVVRICSALAELGARRVVLLSFHGSPMHNLAIQAGVTALTSANVQAVAPLNLLLRELLAPEHPRLDAAYTVIDDRAEREAMRQGLRWEFHAGFTETSIALHYAPDSVSPRYRDVPPCPELVPSRALLAAGHLARAAGQIGLANELDLVAGGIAWYTLRPFPGYCGRPHRARAEAGAILAQIIVEIFTECIDAVFRGEELSPEPLLPWLADLSLGGLLWRPTIRRDEMLAIDLRTPVR